MSDEHDGRARLQAAVDAAVGRSRVLRQASNEMLKDLPSLIGSAEEVGKATARRQALLEWVWGLVREADALPAAHLVRNATCRRTVAAWWLRAQSPQELLGELLTDAEKEQLGPWLAAG
jgi:hypothetical protein